MRSTIDIKITKIKCSRGLLRLAVLAIAFGLFETPVAFAQKLDDVAELPGLTVTAPVNFGSEPDWVRPEKVLQEDELRRKREASLGDMLSRELGVSSSSFGPGASRPGQLTHTGSGERRWYG